MELKRILMLQEVRRVTIIKYLECWSSVAKFRVYKYLSRQPLFFDLLDTGISLLKHLCANRQVYFKSDFYLKSDLRFTRMD